MNTCNIEGCDIEVWSLGMCKKHYAKDYYLKHKEELKLKNNEYKKTEEGRSKTKKYQLSKRGIERRKKYEQSEKGRAKICRRRNKRRVRMYSGSYEIFSKYEVFDKCLWVCALCGEPVEKDLIYTDPMSASLDHIVPLSKGGVHSFDNCQLAHLSCNKKKWNRIEV